MPSNDLLIEIGTEELPPKSLSRMMRSLASSFAAELNAAQFSFDAIKPMATPRRLSLIISNLSDQQPTQSIEKRGPALKAALDGDGNPTKAVQGFMRGCGISDINELEQIETPKGIWLVYKSVKPGLMLKDKINAMLSASLAKLPIERKMRWGASRIEFVRPVHWLVVMYGDQVLPAEILGIGASNQSMGHRFMSSGALTIRSCDDYVEQLRGAKVMVDFSERQATIEQQLKTIGLEEKADVVIDPALLDEVTALVEWPVCLMGRFDRRFLNVPEEALISAMKEHQRYFHLLDKQDKLLPLFITVSNIESTNPATVITGNERVIAPRLKDAEFFFEKDKQTSLEAKLAQLSKVVFQAKLGSYGEKTQRIASLSAYIAAELGANQTDAQRAAYLCKADLVSGMVGEFSDLQGLMGSYYAKFDGETPDVCNAIKDHYKPTGAGSDLPESLVACCVAIADKIDTITGLFSIGLPPTGSKDPFALRRQTLGIIRICIQKQLDLDLPKLISKSESTHKTEQSGADVWSYFLDRLANWYQDLDISADTFNAIRYSNEPIRDLALTNKRIMSLQTFRTHDKAENLIAANKRIANLVKKSDDTVSEVDVNLFEEEAENLLFTAVNQAKQDLAATEDYETKYLILANLQPVIDSYFTDVMVMAEDVNLKANRLATLNQMRALFLSVADLSLLQQ